jgi:hypothetical protein
MERACITGRRSHSIKGKSARAHSAAFLCGVFIERLLNGIGDPVLDAEAWVSRQEIPRSLWRIILLNAEKHVPYLDVVNEDRDFVARSSERLGM